MDDREPVLEDARKRAEKWEFRDENEKPNTVPLKAVQPRNQKTKEEMESSAKRWPNVRSAANVAAFLGKN